MTISSDTAEGKAAPSLRPHQVNAIAMLRASLLAGNRAPMLSLPTGSGKTVIAAQIVNMARAKRKRVAFGVPALSLIDQTFERFVENGIEPAEMGVCQGDHPWRRPHAPIQICSAQTLVSRGWPEVDLAIIDEAHRKFDVYDRWMTTDEKRPVFVGLTATPWAKGLGKFYDDLIKPTTMQELIEAGYLSKFRVFAPSHPDLTGVKTVAGDYHEGQLADRMSNAELVADVVKTWLAKAEGRSTLCFAVNRAHAALLAERFAAAGVAVAYIDANTPREERDVIGKRLQAGEIQVVCNIGCLTTGIDWDVRCIVLACPTKSEMLFVQIIGRGLRTAPGKDHCLVLDHSDTHLRLGMVTDIDHDELDDGKAKRASSSRDEDREERLPRECRVCAGLIPPGASECPCCGAAQLRTANVSERDGELSEFAPGSKKARRKSGEPVIEFLRRLPKGELHAQLKAIASERGRSAGWVAHKFREVWETWPRGFDREAESEPSSTLRSWVRSRDIAWAKAQPRREEAA